MIANLKDYEPKHIEYVLGDAEKELFPAELDFTKVKGQKIKTAADAMKYIGKCFNATFPANETAERNLDEFEVHNIREEYCVLQENEVPKRKMNLEETLEQIKSMKKRAEESYNSILMEVAKYAAEVKQGTREQRLSAKNTFCIALAGYYVIYTYDKESNTFVLAKAFQVSDRCEIWAQESMNRDTMLKDFGLEFPEPEKPEEAEDADDGTDNNGDDLPFGDA